MKDFDIVKFTMWLGVALLVAVLGGQWWVRGQLKEEQLRLRSMKGWLQDIGRTCSDIDFRERELSQDKFLEYRNRAATFFQTCALQARIDANRDYRLDPKDPEPHQGFQDTIFTLTLQKDREKGRQQLAQLCYAVETLSPSVKLVKCKLTLEHNQAEADLWKATLVFLRRDPLLAN